MRGKHVLCFSIHPKHTWVLPACVCGAGCWWRGRKGGYPPILPAPRWLSNPCRESAGAGSWDSRPSVSVDDDRAGFSLPFSPPASETGDVHVLNCPLAVSHGSECPSHLPFSGGEPRTSSTCSFEGEGRDCHQPKRPSTS